LTFLALVISCAGGNEDSPIGDIDEFLDKPLDIYVEMGDQNDYAFGSSEDGTLDDSRTEAGRPVHE